MDIYKFAAQKRLRFSSVKGDLTAEQLFDLPLKSQTGSADLDTVARTINNELKGLDQESFVDVGISSPRKQLLENALAIVKDVIKTKQDANAADLLRRDNRERKQKLLAILERKEDEKLSATSIEDIKKQLAEMPD